MTLLKKIHIRNVWWIYNNRTRVELTEEQKRLKAKQDEFRRLRVRKLDESIQEILIK